MNISTLVEALDAVTGWDLTVEEAMQVGLRAVNLMRVFNIKSELTSDLDWLSSRYGSTPADGPATGQSIIPHFE
jgi:aldehyde:ferredoxin oxidoreductase